jgi:hydroxyethylthiazole kinase
MAHALEEVEEMVGLASALVINIGTLSKSWIEAMLLAGRTAKRKGIPIVLDPVGCGATRLRTETALRILKEDEPAILRGNGSEIRALHLQEQATRGVDSRHTAEAALEAAQNLSLRFGCAVSVSGPVDFVVHGDDILRVSNGHPLMPRVTGLGCAASALTGAFAAVDRSPLLAGAHAMAVMGIAGEMAAERAEGPGSFQVRFLDALYRLRKEDIVGRLKMETA